MALIELRWSAIEPLQRNQMSVMDYGQTDRKGTDPDQEKKLDTEDCINDGRYREVKEVRGENDQFFGQTDLPHRDFFGKNSPDILFIKEMRMMLKKMVSVNTYADIEHVKYRIDGMKLNKSGRLRSSLKHEKPRSTMVWSFKDLDRRPSISRIIL